MTRPLRRVVPFGLLTILMVLTATAVGVALRHEGRAVRSAPVHLPQRAPDAGFAGYTLIAPVHQIQAEWSVPTIAATSAIGHASTWVGVDDTKGDFIQLGTIEDQLSQRNAPSYELFWSDTDLGDLAQGLGRVQAGEPVTVTMRQTRGGWVLTARVGQRTLADFDSRYGGGAAFGRSLWLQENPVLSLQPLRYKPYPTMSGVTVTGLEVNGEVPHLDFADAQTLSTSDLGSLAPTKVFFDAFRLLVPSGPAADYLHIIGGVDLALNQFSDTFDASGGPDQISAATRAAGLHAIAAINDGDAALFATAWPAAASPDVSRFIEHNVREARALSAWLSARPAHRSTAFGAFATQSAGNGDYSDAVRAALGLPPTH
jgi:hypothetical protein